MNLFISLAVTYDPDRDEPASLTAALEEIIGVWSPLGTSGFVSELLISKLGARTGLRASQ